VKAVFLDRDGVINKKRENSYVLKWEQFEFLPHVKEAIKSLNDKKLPIYVISNQACVNKGLITRKQLEDIHNRMQLELNKVGAHIDDIFVCPHRIDENCDCRKPRAGLFMQSKAKYPEISFKDSLFIGDSDMDVEAGEKAGVMTIKLSDGDDILDTVKGIIK
jgi:D-glycero-D-manno-heptose 1,7-bisphosphate phosphatase